MEFVIKNTRTNEVREIPLEDAEKMFYSDSFCTENVLEEEYNELDEEGKSYWDNGRATHVYSSKEEFVSDMVEHVTWTSPEGIKPEFMVIETK